MRFSEKETCKIVELYRQCECLWNIKDPNYKNRQVRWATCEAIAREMNIENFTAADVKCKLKSLRTTYLLELPKIKGEKKGFVNYKTNLKWFPIFDSVYKMIKKNERRGDDSSVENEEHASESILTDDTQWEPQSEEIPSMPSESELEQSVRSISDVEATPEIQSVQSVSNSDGYSVVSEDQKVQPVSHSLVTTVAPQILTVKSVSSLETVTVTSGNQPLVTAATSPSETQTVKPALAPKIYALIPESFNSVSNPRFVAVSTGSSNQNLRYVSSSSAPLPPEIQQRIKKVSSDEATRRRKRHHEEVSSTDSNADVHQMNNSRTVNGDFSERNDDEMDAFGRFVGLNLKKMSIPSAMSAQSEILSILTRHRLNDSATNPSSNQTFPYIVTNGSSTTQSPVLLQKVFLKS